jgi:hypothetical protein
MNAHQVRRFHLKRDVDVSGVSGTGIVAFGVQAPNGTCVLWWDSEHESIGIYPSMDTLLAIHGHSGATQAVFVDDPAFVNDRAFVDDLAAESADDLVAGHAVQSTRAAVTRTAASRTSARTATRATGGRSAPSRGSSRSVKASRPAAGRTATASLTTPLLTTPALTTPALTTPAPTGATHSPDRVPPRE